MMEILFRGKRIDNGEWVEGFYWFDNFNKKHKITVNLSDDNFTCHEVDPETVGQFTGSVDKNGKKIFEGDILEWFCLDEEEFDRQLSGVVFHKGAFRFFEPSDTTNMDNADVISEFIGYMNYNAENLRAFFGDGYESNESFIPDNGLVHMVNRWLSRKFTCIQEAIKGISGFCVISNIHDNPELLNNNQ